MTNQEKPRLALKPGKWFAAPATSKAKAALSGFETGPKLPGYSLIRTTEIGALTPKLESVEGAGKVLQKAGTESYAEISTAEIARIGTGPGRTTEIALPKPPRGGKSGRRWIRAAARRQRVYGNQRIAA